ncbi:pyrroline-5-carboxylate reductase (plasmid) [Ensifer sp. WSM1721]|uniref:pyrroline-5-carboxylate reductase n=1 Tax=Ensifer sp. WSM1721 TaxID=1041159 RepID=UPI0004B8A124|nr:pyrroline-5-carboxylate reductase [Ensifer sp. WSM1721]
MNILLIGCGNMGAAMAVGISRDYDYDLVIVDPDLQRVRQQVGASVAAELASNLSEISGRAFDLCIVAVKPNLVQATARQMAQLLTVSLTVSIAAGIDIASLRSWSSPATKIVRAMPNLAASVGQSMTVAVAEPSLSREERTTVKTILETAGRFAWLEDEAFIDPVTAVAGSGPAYVFAFAQYLAAAASSLGLEDTFAAELVRQTLIGAAGLMERTESSFPQLKAAVTSPGGTTEAGLSALESGTALADLLQACVAKAAARAAALRTEAATRA